MLADLAKVAIGPTVTRVADSMLVLNGILAHQVKGLMAGIWARVWEFVYVKHFMAHVR